MDFYNLISTNLEFFIPEIFFIISLLGLIFYGSIVNSYNHILTFYTNKISFCIVGIILVLTINTFSFNYELTNLNFLILTKFLISLSVLACLDISVLLNVSFPMSKVYFLCFLKSAIFLSNCVKVKSSMFTPT